MLLNRWRMQGDTDTQDERCRLWGWEGDMLGLSLTHTTIHTHTSMLTVNTFPTSNLLTVKINFQQYMSALIRKRWRLWRHGLLPWPYSPWQLCPPQFVWQPELTQVPLAVSQSSSESAQWHSCSQLTPNLPRIHPASSTMSSISLPVLVLTMRTVLSVGGSHKPGPPELYLSLTSSTMLINYLLCGMAVCHCNGLAHVRQHNHNNGPVTPYPCPSC